MNSNGNIEVKLSAQKAVTKQVAHGHPVEMHIPVSVETAL